MAVRSTRTGRPVIWHAIVASPSQPLSRSLEVCALCVCVCVDAWVCYSPQPYVDVDGLACLVFVRLIPFYRARAFVQSFVRPFVPSASGMNRVRSLYLRCINNFFFSLFLFIYLFFLLRLLYGLCPSFRVRVPWLSSARFIRLNRPHLNIHILVC